MHRFKLRMAALCLAIGVGLLCQAHADCQEMRTWKDSTGSFSIDAVLISQDQTTVRLKSSDGRVISVPRTQLSVSDLNYLKSQPVTKKLTALEAERLLSAKLSGPQLSIDPDETLPDLLSRLGIPVFLDLARLKQVGVTQNIRIHTDLQAGTLADQLDAILGPLNLTWYRQRSVLIVSSRSAAQKHAMETLVYRVPSPRNDPSAVVKKIQTVEPSSWDVLGGRGTVVAMPGVFVIRQTGEIHRKLESQLRIRAIPHRYVDSLDNQIVSIRMEDGKLDAFAEQLQGQLGRKVTVSDADSDEARLTMNLINVTAADALDLMTYQSEYQWFENPNGVEFVPNAYTHEKIEERPVTVAFGSPQLAPLIRDSMMKLVEPRSWAPLGGPGQIQHAGGKTYQISQTQPVFRKLRQLIADLGGAN